MAAQLSDMLKNFLQDDELAPGVKVGMLLLTPAIAKDFLARTPQRQRSRSKKTVERYLGDQLSGKWRFLADVIRFNEQDEMIDGQHRCQSVLDSGIAQPTLVAFGLERNAIIAMDSGRPRKFNDQLRMEDVENHASVGALTKMALHWMRGNYADESVARVHNPQFLHVSLSTGTLWDTYEAMSHELIQSARHGLSTSRHFRRSAPAAVFSFCWLLFGRIDLDARERFFNELVEGPSQLGPEYSIAQLRSALTKVRTSKDRLVRWQWLHYFIATWNKMLRNETSGLRLPSEPKWNHLAMPFDPNEMQRGEGWEPLPNITTSRAVSL